MANLGNKDFYFEIAANEIQGKLVPIRIFINGEIIGTLDSPTYMPSFINCLISLLKDPYYYRQNLNEEEFFNNLKRSLDTDDNFRITFEETFDDYVKRAGRNDNKVFFLWYIHKNHFFKYSESELDSINLQSVAMDDVRKAVNALIEWCENYMCISYEVV
ncbi:hypothetical protein SAMN05421749_101598 [Acinetobacter marinus]|uniref:Immunity protein 42 n=1 Tax=Acinetobacter marinus TaxID=281375 RepID=A0A1G6GZJ4_9GAMM|nr:hypothetical protein [Acinetobacter marinus]SDB87429.1 hypothetical protein SAMN05421749_101598 [Acinetobacter marinus]